MAKVVVSTFIIEQESSGYADVDAVEIEFNKEDQGNSAKLYIRQHENEGDKKHEIFFGDRNAVEALVAFLQFSLQQKWGV